MAFFFFLIVPYRSDALCKPSHSGRSSCDSEIQLYNVDELQSDGSSLKVSIGGVFFLGIFLLKLFFNFTTLKVSWWFLKEEKKVFLFLLWIHFNSLSPWSEGLNLFCSRILASSFMPKVTSAWYNCFSRFI